MAAELEVRDLNAWYGSVQALRGVSLTLEKGECVAVLGANGAGKTTLLRAISHMVPYRGDVLLRGDRLVGPAERVVRRGIGHVLEGRHIFTGMTVKDNLRLARFGATRPGFSQRMEAVLSLFPALARSLNRPGGELSGGQQQQLAIGRGLLTAPSVLMLDEPMLGIAPIVVEQLIDVLPVIRAEWDISILIADQSVILAGALADRAYILQAGQIVYHTAEPGAAGLDARLLAKYFGTDSATITAPDADAVLRLFPQVSRSTDGL